MVFVVSSTEFVQALDALYASTEGSVWLSFKQISDKRYRQTVKAATGQEPKSSKSTRCLVRATDGHKKLSTAIQSRDVVFFMELLGQTFRAQFSGLKHHEKGKRGGRRK